MTDEWEFRTARGRGSVADGALRVENSLVGMARNQWVGRERWGRLLFLFTTFTTIWGFRRVATAGRTAMNGGVGPGEAIVLGAFALVALGLLRRVLRTRTVPLRRIRSVRRVDDERVRVVYAKSDDAGSENVADLEIETPTGADAEEAVEILRLKGVRIGSDGDTEAESTSLTFRERLAKKVE